MKYMQGRYIRCQGQQKGVREMLRMSRYENWLAARLVESYQRHSTMNISDEIEHIRQQAVDLDIQQFWLLTQER